MKLLSPYIYLMPFFQRFFYAVVLLLYLSPTFSSSLQNNQITMHVATGIGAIPMTLKKANGSNMLLVGGLDGRAILYDPLTKKEIISKKYGAVAFRSASIGNRGDTIALGTTLPGNVIVSNLYSSDYKKIATNDSDVLDVEFSEDQSKVYSIGVEGDLVCLSLEGNELWRVKSKAQLGSAIIIPKASYAILGGTDKVISRLNFDGNIKTISTLRNIPTSIAISSDLKLIAVGYGFFPGLITEHKIDIFNADSGELVNSIDNVIGVPLGMQFSSNNKMLAVITAGGFDLREKNIIEMANTREKGNAIFVFSLNKIDSQLIFKKSSLPDPLTALQYDEKQTGIYAASWNGELSHWKINDKKESPEILIPSPDKINRLILLENKNMALGVTDHLSGIKFPLSSMYPPQKFSGIAYTFRQPKLESVWIDDDDTVSAITTWNEANKITLWNRVGTNKLHGVDFDLSKLINEPTDSGVTKTEYIPDAFYFDQKTKHFLVSLNILKIKGEKVTNSYAIIKAAIIDGHFSVISNLLTIPGKVSAASHSIDNNIVFVAWDSGGMENANVVGKFNLITGKELWRGLLPGNSATIDIDAISNPYILRVFTKYAILGIHPGDDKWAILGGHSGKPLIINKSTHSGKITASADASGDIEVRNWPDGFNLKKLSSSKDNVVDMSFSSNEKQLYTLGSEQTLNVWDLPSGKSRISLVSFNDDDWAAVSAEGAFMASARGAEKVYLEKQNDFYRLDQIYDALYRPDIVSEIMEGIYPSDVLIKDFDYMISPPPPHISIKSEKVLGSPGMVRIHLKAKENRSSGIGDIRLYSNGKLIWQRTNKLAISLGNQLNKKLEVNPLPNVMVQFSEPKKIDSDTQKDNGKKSSLGYFELSLDLALVSGRNIITAIAFNGNNNVQSTPVLIIEEGPKVQKESKVYLLAFGVDKFYDSSMNLSFASKDANVLATELNSLLVDEYGQSNVYTYILTSELTSNKQPTLKNLTQVLNTIQKVAKPQDIVIFYASTHGLNTSSGFSLATSDYGENKLNSNVTTGFISASSLMEWSKNTLAQKQLFILDSCYSGQLKDDLTLRYDSRLQFFSNQLGINIVTASSPIERAREGYPLTGTNNQKHGFFTWNLLEGIKEIKKTSPHEPTVNEWLKYSIGKAKEQAVKENIPQTPEQSNDGVDFILTGPKHGI